MHQRSAVVQFIQESNGPVLPAMFAHNVGDRVDLFNNRRRVEVEALRFRRRNPPALFDFVPNLKWTIGVKLRQLHFQFLRSL